LLPQNSNLGSLLGGGILNTSLHILSGATRLLLRLATSRLHTTIASTCARGALANTGSTATCTNILVRISGRLAVIAASNVLALSLLMNLHICKTFRLAVDIPHLLLAILVKLSEPLAGSSPEGLFEVPGETSGSGGGLLADLVLLVNGSGGVGSVGLGVDGLERVREEGSELGGQAMLLVELDTPLEYGIAQDVSVGEVFCKDGRAGLGFLRNLAVRADIGGGGKVRTGDLVDGVGGPD